MKQTARLLSFLLAVIMFFSVLSVGVQGAVLKPVIITKSGVAYDSVDNAVLSPAQVATIICDRIDEVLAKKNIYYDLSIGVLNLTSIDNAFSSISELFGGYWAAMFIGSDLEVIKSNASYLRDYTRATSGDLAMIRQFIGFVSSGDAPEVFSKIAYGIENGDNSLSLGLIGNFIGFKGLTDIPDIVNGLIFDKLLRGTYSYPKTYETSLYTTTPTTFTEWSEYSTKPFTGADEMINTALYNLFTKPQDKALVYNSVTGLMGNKWDMDSELLPTVTASAVNLNSNSILGIIDNVIQLAYNELATKPLNNDLKKILMEATGAEFVRVKNPSPGLLAAFQAAEAEGIKNCFVNSATFEYNGKWYYSDYVSEGVDENNDGIIDTDAHDVEITQPVRRYFKANTSHANDLYNLINWNYEFTADDYSFATELGNYGSIVGELNHLLYFILNKTVNDTSKAEIESFLNDGQDWFIDGDNSNINTNILRLAKYVFCNFTEEIFGKTSEYVGANGNALASFAASVKACTSVEDLLTYIAAPILGRIMPELIIPELTSGLQVEQLGVLALREAISVLTPALNFDSEIFAAGTLTSASGRALATKTGAQWNDLLLGMGLSLAMTYLDNVTNIDFDSAKTAALYAANGWRGLLEEIVDWAVAYIGSDNSSVIQGLSPTALGSVRGTFNNNAFTILSTVLNTVLPLGMICGCGDTDYACNIETLLLGKIIPAVEDFNIPLLLSVFGRSGSSDNLLTATNAISTVLGLLQRTVNLVLPGAVATTYLTKLDDFNSLLNFKELIKNTLIALNTYAYAGGTTSGLFYGKLLPIIASFIPDWSGEQILGSPETSIKTTYSATAGTLAATSYTISNGSKGIWRRYMNGTISMQDEQYAYEIVDTTATVVSGTDATVTIPALSRGTGRLSYGQSNTVTFTASEIPTTGAVVKFTSTYKVCYGSSNEFFADGAQFEVNDYVFISYNPTNSKADTNIATKGSEVHFFSPHYVAFETGASKIPDIATYKFVNNVVTNCSCQVLNVSTAQNGINLTAQAKTTVKADTIGFYKNFTVDKTTYDSSVATGLIAAGTTMTWTATGKAYNAISQSTSATGSIVIKFYSEEYLEKVQGLAASEASIVRNSSDYNTTVCYADRVLVTALSATADIPQETNFTGTGENAYGKTVTLIDGAQAWTNYMTAFVNAFTAALQPWNANSVYTHEECYNALLIAKSDLEYCRKTASQASSASNTAKDNAVEALASQISTIEGSVGSSKDYMLYRWNRFASCQNSTHTLVSLYNAAKANVDSTYFPYSDIDADNLEALVSGDVYETYILALRKARTAKEMTVSNKAILDAAAKYATEYTLLDISRIADMLDKTSERLIAREGGTVKTYLDAEIASASAIYGSEATSTIYSGRSWARYLECLAAAQEQSANGVYNQKIADAKTELQKAVNGLIPIAEGADYSGLEDAITTAQAVLGNLNLYEDDAKGIGEVIAALGYTIDDIKLFPGAALDVNETPYTSKDQKKVDTSEESLRLALANVRFIGTALVKADENTDVSTELQGTGNDSYYATVPKNLPIESVYGYLRTDNVPSSIKGIAPTLVTADATSAGTGIVVTYYGTIEIDGKPVIVPVASFTVVVKGDVTGDAEIDSADVMIADLVLNSHSRLDGAYLKAGLLDEATEIDGVTVEDVQRIHAAAVKK